MKGLQGTVDILNNTFIKIIKFLFKEFFFNADNNFPLFFRVI